MNKTPTGAVEAKVACYYRRRDVSNTLINQAEKYCEFSIILLRFVAVCGVELFSDKNNTLPFML
ncbi:unnamed protein product [Trichobilharzia regenti]|nr:unnamed protein product [Trichobilharzia regenti]